MCQGTFINITEVLVDLQVQLVYLPPSLCNMHTSYSSTHSQNQELEWLSQYSD